MDKRPFPLIGYAAMTDVVEDWSYWSGEITGPDNPRGANLSWLDPIPFIEKAAYDDASKKIAEASEALRVLILWGESMYGRLVDAGGLKEHDPINWRAMEEARRVLSVLQGSMPGKERA